MPENNEEEVVVVKPYVKFQKGSSDAYKNLEAKDFNTLYFVTDDDKTGELYLGDMFIVGDVTTNELTNLKETLQVADSALAQSITEAMKHINELADADQELQGQITAVDNKIETLDAVDNIEEGKYVAAVSQTDGAISVSKKPLPTYTLTTGTDDGTVQFNGTPVAVKGYNDLVNYVAKLENLALSTSVSINMKNSTGNLYDILYNKSPDVAQSEDGLIIPDGSWINFSIVGVEEAGIYGVNLIQEENTAAANLRLETNENYYKNIIPTEVDANIKDNNYYIYLKKGNNKIVIINTGNNVCYLKDIIFENTDNYLPNLVINKLETYTESINPEAWQKKVPTWTGDHEDLTDYFNGYVNEEYIPSQTFAKSNGTSAVSGVDYSVNSIGSDGSLIMIKEESWANFEINVPYTGVYGITFYCTWLPKTATLHTETQNGYYSDTYFSETGYSYNQKQDQLLYLQAGINQIKVTSHGEGNIALATFGIVRFDKQGAESSLDLLPLVNKK